MERIINISSIFAKFLFTSLFFLLLLLSGKSVGNRVIRGMIIFMMFFFLLLVPHIKVQAAISSVTFSGSAVSDASSTTVTVTPAANLTAGKLVVVASMSDNNDTADGATTFHSISDSKSNTWTRVSEYTETDGAADDGSTVSIFATKITTQIDTTDTITLTLGTAKTDKIITVTEATLGAGTGWVIEQVGVGQAAIAASVSSLPSRYYFLFSAGASEGEDVTKTADADYSEQFDSRTSSTGALDINIAGHVQTRVATLTTDTVTSTAWTNTNPIMLLAAIYEPAAVLTGSAVTCQMQESDIVNGLKTIIITLSGDTWVAAGSTFDNQRDEIIAGLDSAQSEATGWDAVVKNNISLSNVVRTNNTVVTITLDAFASYNITATETITATIPSTALTGGNTMVATPTFSISVDQITFTEQDTPDINNSANATSYASSSWTPPTCGLIYAFVQTTVTTQQPPIPSVTGNSLTWVLIHTRVETREKRFSLFAANASGATTGAKTFDFTGFTKEHLIASFT